MRIELNASAPCRSPPACLSVLQRLSLLLLLMSALNSVPAQSAELDRTVNFDIPAQPLESALRVFSRQANIQLVIAPNAARDASAPTLRGALTASAALTELLDASGLKYASVGHTVTIAPLASNQTAHAISPRAGGKDSFDGDPALADTPQQLKLAEADSAARDQNDESTASSNRPHRSAILEEVVITGSNIHGEERSASHVDVYTRSDIQRMGVATVEQFIQKLPQNFGGGASEITMDEVSGGGGTANAVGGTGVNLRGLGSSSTLILVNGRRVAPGNTTGNFVDVSLIPLAALERVEIVADGTSAIYGSDAVGGVVNFILRKDFQGLETQARYGSVTEGASHETEISQVAGTKWDSGSALFSYNFYDRTPLLASDRPYTQRALEPFSLLGEQTRHGAFLNLQDSPTETTNVFAEGMFSKRSYSTDSANASYGAQHSPANVTAYSATLGSRAEVAETRAVELSSTYSHSGTHQAVYDLISAATLANRRTSTSVLSVDAKVDGKLISVPTGDIVFASGLQFRRETLDFSNNVGAPQVYDNARNIYAGFAELRVPVIGKGSGSPGDRILELTMADRYEHYSDFGTTNNPKIGLLWNVFAPLSIRGTYGTSFKAPLLNDLNPVPRAIGAYRLPDPTSASRLTSTVIIFGGNPQLQPEKADTWSIGADLDLRSLTGIKASLTYYNVRYKNRIEDPSVALSAGSALGEEGLLGQEIVSRNPSLSAIDTLYATRNFQNFSSILPSSIGAILDYRTRNLTSQRTDGMDFGLSWTQGGDRTNIELGVDGTYIFKFDTQFTTTAPVAALLNTPYNPIDLKLRARAVSTYEDITVAAFLNYVSSYHDARTQPEVPVASWTTVDVSATYRPETAVRALQNIEVQLSALNIGNASPPFVRNPNFSGIAFDGANANAVGRFISCQISKRW
jgi:iron complex outermembrane recepter protein